MPNKDEKAELDTSFASTSSRFKLEVPPLTLQNSSLHERKFIVVPDTLKSFNLHKLCHPKANLSALYQIDEKSVAEVLEIDAERSCFYGNSVIKNVVVKMLSPIHPLFLALPNLLKQDHPFTIEELTKDVEYPALALLSKIPAFIKALTLTCDSVDTLKFVRNQKKLDEWLSNRFNLLINALKNYDGISDSLKSSESNLKYIAFELFCENIPESLSDRLRSNWAIQKPEARVLTEPVLSTFKDTKRKLETISKKESKKEKQKRIKMENAAKNTMELSSFFKK